MDDFALISEMMESVKIPKFFLARQDFPRKTIERDDIPAVLGPLLEQEKITSAIRPGMKICITAGSRGVCNVDRIIRTIVAFLKEKGADPFIIPAMGSHGGATAEGQRKILEDYGITEETMGCPVRATMEVRVIGKTKDGRDVKIDRYASEADGIVLVNRIKAHTCFRGKYESGLMKMMAIGLAKQAGAQECHRLGFGHMAESVEMFGNAVLENAKILFGVATVENAYDETSELYAMTPAEIPEKEPALLRHSFDLLPSILVDSCDTLIVDEVGKNFSGDGMDPNITGTFATPYASGGIKYQNVCVLDVSDESHGNGNGVGMAMSTTRRCYDKLDLAAMYINGITSKQVWSVRLPIIMKNDREAIQLCLWNLGDIDPEKARIVRIPNSLHLSHVLLSEAYYEEARSIKGLTVLSEPQELQFGPDGYLLMRGEKEWNNTL